MLLRPRFVAAGAAGIGYVVASQWLMTRTPPSEWSAVVLLTPMLAITAVGAWRSRQRGWSGVAAAVMAALVFQAGWGGGFPPQRLYLSEHVAIHLALATWFGSTLRAGSRPLIAKLAGRIHQGLTPAMEAYTRHVTLAWTVYFAAMALASIGVYLAAPFPVWAGFANLASPVVPMLMFVGEYVLRYRLHPEFERATMADAIRAYSQMTGRTQQAPTRGDTRS